MIPDTSCPTSSFTSGSGLIVMGKEVGRAVGIRVNVVGFCVRKKEGVREGRRLLVGSAEGFFVDKVGVGEGTTVEGFDVTIGLLDGTRVGKKEGEGLGGGTQQGHSIFEVNLLTLLHL